MFPPLSKGDGEKAGRKSDLSRLPPGRHGLSRDFVTQNQRERITAGIIKSVGEIGYQETTVKTIAAAAGVSRRSFYAYFSSKEACYFATYDLIIEHVLAEARQAAEPYSEWPDKVRAKLTAVLEAYASNPHLVSFLFIAPGRAGRDIAARYEQQLEEGLAELTEGMPPPPSTKEVTRDAELALLAGAITLITRMVDAGEGEDLPKLVPELLELLLAPYLGREAAAEIAAGS